MEADTIIISENDVLKQVNGAEKCDYPDKADGRTMRVAHIYVNARVLINRCFQICGIDLFNVRSDNYLYDLIRKLTNNKIYRSQFRLMVSISIICWTNSSRMPAHLKIKKPK